MFLTYCRRLHYGAYCCSSIPTVAAQLFSFFESTRKESMEEEKGHWMRRGVVRSDCILSVRVSPIPYFTRDEK